MDKYSFTQDFPGDIFWYDESLPDVNKSAFEPFRDTPRSAFDLINGSDNMNKRVIGFLRRSLVKTEQNRSEAEHEKERGFRHMMNERMRREKQKQSYSALHSLLPMGTKNDKNSIVQIAVTKIQQLERCRERLKRRMAELEAVLADERPTKWTKVKVKVADPTSGVDSMMELLNCLKRLGLKAQNIHSVFAEEEFSAELEIETEVGAADIEHALQVTLHDAELKLRSPF